MAYFIFLKYLRSLEEFRKILVSKFLLNLLVQISKALAYSKIQFLSEKNFSSTFSPIGPVASRPIRPFGPERPSRPSQPIGCPPFPFLPPSPSRRRRRLFLSRCCAAPLPRHGATPTDAPLLNSVACLYSVINLPQFTTCNRRLHGRPLKPPPVPPPPSDPYKRRRPSPGPRLTHPHSL
jgi:hypothetical protein